MATTKLAFTKRSIESLQPPKSARMYVYDVGQPNLALCVTPSGAKTFYRIGRIEGRPIRYRIGPFPALSVEGARNEARAKTGEIASGKNPHTARLAKRHEQTLQGLFDYWLEENKTRKRTWADDQRMFDKYLADWHSRRLSSIGSNDVRALHARLGRDHGPYQANRIVALLRAMFGKGPEMGFLGGNPCLGLKRFPEQSRERYLLTDEMKPFFLAVKAEPPYWRDFWLLCLFTGARSGNVKSMTWGEVDLPSLSWHLPAAKMKNKKPLTIGLPAPAVAILQARLDSRNGSPFVFPADGETGHVADARKSWLRVLKAAGIENLRPHDLRRSLGSWQAVAGSSLPIIGASLGHSAAKSTSVYARLSLDPVRASVSGAVDKMIEAGEPAKKPRGGRNGKK